MAAASVTRHGDQAPALAKLHAELVRDSSIQWALPEYQPPKLPHWLEAVLRFFSAIAPALGYIFWALVAVGLAAVLWLIARQLIGDRFPWRRGKSEPDEEVAAWQPETAVARTLLSEADALAAEGRFEDAVRLLLRRSVEDIGARLPQFLRPSLTARDIAAAPALPDRARRAFGTIAVETEAAVFAQAGLDATGWSRARDAYAEFALGQSWKARAS